MNSHAWESAGPFIQMDSRDAALIHAVRLGVTNEWDADEVVTAAKIFVDFLNEDRQ